MVQEFEAVFQKYHSDVYRFLLKMSDYDKEMAEELTSETFYQAYLAIARFKGKCQIKTWLIQIAKNQFYAALRKQKFKPTSFEDVVSEPAEDPVEEKIEEAYQRELLCHARSIIEAMAPKMKEVMLYRIYSDLPYTQIAILLSISESSAKVLYHRGKELLRKKLKEDHGYEI